MRLDPFLLDEWFDESASMPIRWNLGSSTGPHWTVGQVLALASADERKEIDELVLEYSVAPGPHDLRAAIAAFYGIDAEEVVVVTGASEAMHAIYFDVARPGANVVVPAPNFAPLAGLPRALGMEVRTYRLDRERGFALDLDEIAGLVDDDTAVLLVNSPHNPTGAVASDSEIDALRDLAMSHGARLVSDEVYHPIYFDRPMASLTRHRGATVVGDMSKSFSMAGLRLGWVVERDPDARERLVRARMYFTATNNPLAERLALVALRRAEKILARSQAVASANLDQLRSFMPRWQEVIEWVEPRGGTVGFPWLRSGEDSRPLCQLLRAAGLLVVPGDAFGAPEHIRIGFGAEPDLSGALATASRVFEAYFAREMDRSPEVAA